MKFIIAYGSVRTDRLGIRAAHYMIHQLEGRGHEIIFFDAKELQLPLLDKMYKEYEQCQAPEPLERMAEQIRSCDGVVLVTGEYNHSLQPGLANMLYYFLEEWFWRPSAIVCYSAGRFGGVRAAVHLRAVLAELGMPSIPSLLPIGKIQTVFEADGTLLDMRLQKQADLYRMSREQRHEDPIPERKPPLLRFFSGPERGAQGSSLPE